jgi:O-antigen/teichoic acid export membrane protein
VALMADDGDAIRPELKEVRPPEARLDRFAKHALLVLKAGNLGLITFYSFAIIYVLVRVIAPNLYPWIVFITSIGNYILASDLGFGGYIYASLRKSFLQAELMARARFASDAVNAYFYIALGAAAIAAVFILATLHLAPAMRIAIALYFTSIVVALPWSLIRRITSSIDLLVSMEAIEAVRRVVTIILAGAMLLGMSFIVFSALSLILWAIAFAASLALIRSQGIALTLVSPREAFRFIRENKQHVYSTGKLTGFEFVIYNHPYLLLPLLLGNASSIIAYDVFYKIVRFGGVACNVAVETFLPSQTRAFYARDWPVVRRYRWIVVALSLIPFLLASAFLVVLGQRFMVGLVSTAHPIDPSLRYLSVAMLGAIVFQASAGGFMVGIGEYALLGNLSMITVTVMAISALVVWFYHLPFIIFMFCFVAAYWLHTAMYQWAFHRSLRSTEMMSAT